MNGAIKMIVISGVILISVLGFSCSREIPNTVSPPIIGDVPHTPTNVTATIGDRLVFLTWSVPDTQGIGLYRIYIADSSDSTYTVLAEVMQMSYTAINLNNGLTYYFRISSVNHAGFEGYRCQPVVAIPNLYGLVINGGQQYTNSRDVSLTPIAPTGTTYMQVSNDSSFDGAIWENFASAKAWQLTPGDLLKTIYIKYRGQGNQAIDGFVSATITLDTRAIIDSLIFTPSDRAFMAGDHIHFKMYSGEPDGVAHVVVGNGLLSIELFDDGTGGDALAGDGIYEAEYTVNGNIEFNSEIVYGNFTDRANNSADQVQARENMSIRRAPDPVTIFSIIAPRGFFDRLELNWNASSINDFAQYRIYRSSAASVDSSDYLSGVLSSAGITAFTDTGLEQNAVYYYRLYVIDNDGLWTGSNEVHATTNQNSPPDPVVLYPIVAPLGSHDRLSLSWSASNDHDFLRYEVYRSYDNIVDSSDILIMVSPSQTAVIDSNLASDSTYYYRILALDQSGNSTWSNTLDGRTGIDLPPDAATLFPIELEPDYYQDVRLQWTLPYTPDFQAFRIYSWRTDSGRPDSALVAIITNQDSTSFIDHPIFFPGSDTLNYWYIVHTYDLGGNSAGSNIVLAHLMDLAPGLVTGTVIAESTFLSISWTASDIPDFGSYRLLRDTLSVPDQSRPVFTSSDENTTSCQDGNIVQGHTYYYWLTIYDRRGHSSRSFIGSSRW